MRCLIDLKYLRVFRFRYSSGSAIYREGRTLFINLRRTTIQIGPAVYVG